MADRTNNRQRPSGAVIGSTIGVVFGLVFVEVNSGGLPGRWSVGIRIAGAVIAVALLAGVRHARRSAADAPTEHAGFADRRYWTIVGLEAIALLGGLAVINSVSHRPTFAVPWIALVVGVHFFGLVRLWRVRSFGPLGVALVGLGLAGFLLAGFGAATTTVDLVSGVGSGIALYATAATAMLTA